MNVTVIALDPESVAPHGIQMDTTSDEDYLLVGLGKTRTEVSTDATRTHYRDLHQVRLP